MSTYPKQCCHFGVLIASYGDDDEDEEEEEEDDDDDDDDDHDDDDDEKSMYGTTWTTLEHSENSGNIWKIPRFSTHFHRFPHNLELILELTWS